MKGGSPGSICKMALLRQTVRAKHFRQDWHKSSTTVGTSWIFALPKSIAVIQGLQRITCASTYIPPGGMWKVYHGSLAWSRSGYQTADRQSHRLPTFPKSGTILVRQGRILQSRRFRTEAIRVGRWLTAIGKVAPVSKQRARGRQSACLPERSML
jgi:hypothetical protein